MKFRNLGASDLKVSVLGLGGSNFGARLDRETSELVIRRALDLGINFIDTADNYGEERSETIIGETLGAQRQSVVLATKFSWRGRELHPLASREHVMTSVERSLRKLKTDYIDLYQLHWPDPVTPIEETLRALDDLIQQGKVRYIGSSNLSAWELVDADWTAKANGLNRFISSQSEYNLAIRTIEKDVLPVLRRKGLGLIPHFPLANGIFTGKYQSAEAVPEGSRLAGGWPWVDRYLTPANIELAKRLGAYAQSRGHTILELAFGWLLAEPIIGSVIAGASRISQLEQNLQAIDAWTLSAHELAEVREILEPSQTSVAA